MHAAHGHDILLTLVTSSKFLSEINYFLWLTLKEVALLRNIRRTASVAVKEDVELMVVDKDVFGKVCSDIYEREMREKMLFCR